MEQNEITRERIYLVFWSATFRGLDEKEGADKAGGKVAASEMER